MSASSLSRLSSTCPATETYLSEYSALVGGGVGPQDVRFQPVQAPIHLSSHGNLPVRDGNGVGPQDVRFQPVQALIPLSRLSPTCPVTETYLSEMVMMSLNTSPL